MSATFGRQEERNPSALTPFYKLSIVNKFLSAPHATRRFTAEITTGCVSLIWHTTHMKQKNVGDSVRAGCGDKPHVRFGRGGLVFLSYQDLAFYLTSWKERSTRVDGRAIPRAKGHRWSDRSRHAVREMRRA